MESRLAGRWKPLDVVSIAAFAVIAAHLVNAFLIQSTASIVWRSGWLIATLGATVAAGYFYRSLAPARKGVVALAIGLPAFLVGLAVHAVHVGFVGFDGGTYTGIPMLAAGLVLTVLGVTLLVRRVRSWWLRLLFVPATLALLIFVVAPVAMGIAYTHIPRLPVCCDDNPAEHGFVYEEVTFQTEDGLTLAAWYIPSKNGAAIITVHGAFRPRVSTMPEAAVLAKHGYGVLMLDLEGYGDSEGRINTLGWVGARDVHAAVAWLQTRPEVDPDRIGGLGLSMGGEVLVQAAGESDDLKAIVAEGATSRTWDDVDEVAGFEGKLGATMQGIIGLTMRVISGESTPPPLKEMVRQIGPRDALLISADKPEERDMSRMYQEEGGPSIQHWEAPVAKHIGALDLAPELYEERVIGFFNATLLQVGAEAP